MVTTAIQVALPAYAPVLEKSHNCRNCRARSKSACAGAAADELDRLGGLVSPQQLMAGDTLIEEGETATNVFTVTAGSMKIYKLLSDGRRQITGFLFQGDFLGLAFGDAYTYSAEALADTTVCRFARRQFDSFVESRPAMERRLRAMASNELAAAQDQMVLLGRKTAQERVASFLLDLVCRQERLGREGNVIRLTMTRNDIADYLGLTTETVSRAFTALRGEGVIELDTTTLIRIPQRARLAAIAEGAG